MISKHYKKDPDKRNITFRVTLESYETYNLLKKSFNVTTLLEEMLRDKAYESGLIKTKILTKDED